MNSIGTIGDKAAVGLSRKMLAGSHRFDLLISCVSQALAIAKFGIKKILFESFFAGILFAPSM